MDIDIVLAPRGSARLPVAGSVLVVTTAEEFVSHLRTILEPGGRIGHLRIVDSYTGPDELHPLRATTILNAIRPFFTIHSFVELVSGPVPLAGLPRVVPEAEDSPAPQLDSRAE